MSDDAPIPRIVQKRFCPSLRRAIVDRKIGQLMIVTASLSSPFYWFPLSLLCHVIKLSVNYYSASVIYTPRSEVDRTGETRKRWITGTPRTTQKHAQSCCAGDKPEIKGQLGGKKANFGEKCTYTLAQTHARTHARTLVNVQCICIARKRARAREKGEYTGNVLGTRIRSRRRPLLYCGSEASSLPHHAHPAILIPPNSPLTA